MIEAKPENLIGDRAYESDPLDEELRNDGIEMIPPHRSNRSKPPGTHSYKKISSGIGDPADDQHAFGNYVGGTR